MTDPRPNNEPRPRVEPQESSPPQIPQLMSAVIAVIVGVGLVVWFGARLSLDGASGGDWYARWWPLAAGAVFVVVGILRLVRIARVRRP
jgi:hypothetical protein